MSKRAVSVFVALLAVGTVGGLVELITDADETSSGASVATANWVHVILASVCLAVAGVVWRRNRRKLIEFFKSPFTADGWNRLVDATLALPVTLAELALLLFGRTRSVVRIEAWRSNRLADGEPPRDDPPPPARRGWRFVAGGLVSSALVGVAAVLVWYVPLRAGEQVFAALDPDFTRDAWGGPSYLGASLAHWFDLALLLYAAVTLIGVVNRRQVGRRHRLLGAESFW